MKVLLTGASGFVGGAVLKGLHGYSPVLLSRAPLASEFPVFLKPLSTSENYSEALQGIDVVIHCAARAHVMKDEETDPLSAYRLINVDGTLNLAHQAASNGVKRFIYISSVKVNGESTTGLAGFNEKMKENPEDAYGISKMEAEVGLRNISAKTSMEVVIIRPPLVYGEGVKANYLNLMKLAKNELPLPFGAIHNARSMVYLGNLVGFIVKCIDHPAAANQTFLVSDGEDLSLSGLLRMMRSTMLKPARLIPVPTWLFRLLGALTGKRDLVDRLVGSLQVDSSKAKKMLDWVPPYTVGTGVKLTVEAFLKDNK